MQTLRTNRATHARMASCFKGFRVWGLRCNLPHPKTQSAMLQVTASCIKTPSATLQVTASCIELYNEAVTDLLAVDKSKSLQVRHCPCD